jgi:Domain of unknown function (DUF4253)
MTIRKFISFAVALLAGCAMAGAKLSPQDRALITIVRMEPSVALQVKQSGRSIERLMGVTEDGKEVPIDGIVLNTEANGGLAAIKTLRAALSASPYHIYLLKHGFGHGPDKVTVVRVDDYDYLDIARTNGNNYGIDHTKVVERYRKWDRKYGLNLVGAGPDWLEAEFTHSPANWNRFAQEVYEFCPDVVTQGTESVSELAKEMKESNTVYLWWD